MKVIEIIKEEINNLYEESIWYHGTPDVRDVENVGSFSEKTGSADYITDPQKYNEIQTGLKKAREIGDDNEYFRLIDIAGTLHDKMVYKKPIFFTDKHNVAKTYADPQRAFDYQESVPKTMKVDINDSGRILKVPAYGERFRGIDANAVRKALNGEGISNEDIDKYYNMFQNDIRGGKMRTDILAIIAQQFGFDIVDVIGVLDSYHGGTTKSTVRMVFDPNRIKIIR